MLYPVVIEGSQDGGGATQHPYPEVDTFADLPTSTDSGKVYLVKTSTYLAFPPKLSGFYKDEATGWERKAPYSAYFLDTKAVWYDDGDSTKQLDFELSGITTGNTRTIIAADRDMDLNKLDPAYIVNVAKAGGDYSTIQGAIDSITVGAGEKYIVRIAPGTYIEAITLKDGVSIKGEGAFGDVVVFAATGTAITFGSGSSDVSNITVTIQGTGANFAKAFACSSGTHTIGNCNIICTVTNGYTTVVDVTGGNFIMQSCSCIYTNIGTGAGLHRFVNVSGTAIPTMASNLVIMTTPSTDAACEVSFMDNSRTSTGEMVIGTCSIDIYCTGISFTGEAHVFELTGAATTNLIQSNSLGITVIAGGGSSVGEAFHLEGTTAVRSATNNVTVTGAVSNYFGNIASGATLNSHFDDVSATDWNTGSGTFNAVSSRQFGNLTITGNLGDNLGNSISVATLVAGATNIFPFQSGGYYNQKTHGDVVGITSTFALAINTLYATRFKITKTTTFDRISCEKTSGAGAGTFVRFGIYSDNNNRPGDLVYDSGNIAFDANGEIVDTSISEQLTSGMYWLALVTDTVRTVRAWAADDGTSIEATSSTDTSIYMMVTVAHTFGALPDPFGTATLSTDKPVRINMRAQ